MATEPAIDTHLFSAYLRKYPKEVARSVEGADDAELKDLFASVSTADGAELLERMAPPAAARVFRSAAGDTARELLTAMDPGQAATVLGQMDHDERENLLTLLPDNVTHLLRELMSYPPDTAGAVMDTRMWVFTGDQTVGEAFAQLRQQRIATRALIVADEGRLTGLIPLPQAVLAEPDTPLSKLAGAKPLHVLATAPREDVVAVLERTDVTLLPVVDPSLRLLGSIDHASLVRAVKDDALGDLQTMVGVGKEERALSTPWFAVRQRLPWLNINLLTAFLAAAVVGLFEDTIARFTALAVLLPVVAGQSGNTGAQALAVTMRGLALREIRLHHSFRVLSKETIAGLLNGIAIAIVTCVGVYFWSGSLGLCLVIGIAMVISMMLAGLSGAAIPLLLTVFRQDPAQSGSIVLTTVTDIVGFFSFLGLATVFASLL